MFLKIFLLQLNILFSNIKCAEVSDSSDSLHLNSKVRSLTSSILDMDACKVKLIFKYNEALEVNYSKLKIFEHFRTECTLRNIITKRPCHCFKKLSLRTFNFFLKTKEDKIDLNTFIEFLNDQEMDMIIIYNLIFGLNIELDNKIQNIIANEESHLFITQKISAQIQKNEITLEQGLKLSLGSTALWHFINNSILKYLYDMNPLIYALNNSFENKEFRICSNFIIRYSEHAFVCYVFSYFNIFVKFNSFVQEETESYLPEAGLYVIITLNSTEEEAIQLDRDRFYFIIFVYLLNLQENHKVFINISKKTTELLEHEDLNYLRNRINSSGTINRFNLNIYEVELFNDETSFDSTKPDILSVVFQNTSRNCGYDMNVKFKLQNSHNLIRRILV